MIKIKFLIFFTFFYQIQANLSRQKRLLVVPATSPTRHQFIAGIGVPLGLENEAITYGWTLKAQYFLPESTAEDLKYQYFQDFWVNYTGLPQRDKVKFAVNTASQYLENHQFDNFPFPLAGRRKRREILIDEETGQKYERYDAEVTQVGDEKLKEYQNLEEFDDEILIHKSKIPKYENFPKKTKEELADTSGARWLFYDGLGAMLSAKGFEGRYCVLRGICEAAESKFGAHGGLFGELFHIAFSPSSSDDPIVHKDHYDYVKAEMLGAAGEPCDEIFYQCKKSFLDIFTKVYDFENLKFV